MLTLVRLQVVQAFKAQPANRTAVWPLPSVCALVNLQNVSPRKALIAHGAAVGFLLSVYPSVELQIPQAAELVPAHGAAVGLVRRLVALVPLQLGEGREAFAAVAAEMEPLGKMDPLVNPQVAGLGEDLPTLVAGELRRTLTGFVRLLVGLKRARVLEDHGALVAGVPPGSSLAARVLKAVSQAE